MSAMDVNQGGARDGMMAGWRWWRHGFWLDRSTGVMPVEVAADGSPPSVVTLPQTGYYMGASEVPAPALEHVYVLADRIDDLEVYRYKQ